MPSLDELLKSASYAEALEKMAGVDAQGNPVRPQVRLPDPPPPPPAPLAGAGAAGGAGGAAGGGGLMDTITNHPAYTASRDYLNATPHVRNALMGAGIGAAGLGLSSLLFGDRKKRSLLTDILSGAALGGAGGYGASLWNNAQSHSRNPETVGNADSARTHLNQQLEYNRRRESVGDDGNNWNPLNIPGRMWDRMWTHGGPDSRDAVGAGGGFVVGQGARALGNHLNRNVVRDLPNAFASQVAPSMFSATNAAVRALPNHPAAARGLAQQISQHVGHIGVDSLPRTSRAGNFFRGIGHPAVSIPLGLGISEYTRPSTSITTQQQAQDLQQLTNQLR